MEEKAGGSSKKKTPSHEGRGAHSRHHPFVKLLTTDNVSVVERRKRRKN